jgi:hypothetical protein
MVSIAGLGPFKVDRNGLISPASPALMPRFCVNWRRRLVQARLQQPDAADTNAGTLELITRVGRVPSTGKRSMALQEREKALALLRHLPRLLPQGWAMRLTADHSVVVEAQASLLLPISAIGLVTQLSVFLLALNPYLDAFDDGCIGSAPGGIVKT